MLSRMDSPRDGFRRGMGLARAGLSCREWRTGRGGSFRRDDRRETGGKKGKAGARVRMMSGSLGVILFLPAIGRDARHYQNDSSFQRGTLQDVEFLNAGSGFAI